MKGEVNWQPWCLLALQRAAAALGSRGVEAVGAVSQPVGVLAWGTCRVQQLCLQEWFERTRKVGLGTTSGAERR